MKKIVVGKLVLFLLVVTQLEIHAQVPGNNYTGCLSGNTVYTLGAYQNVPSVGSTWVYRVGINETCMTGASLYSIINSPLGQSCTFNPQSVGSPSYQTGTLVSYQVMNCPIDEELPICLGACLLTCYAITKMNLLRTHKH